MTTPGKTKILTKCNRLSSSQGLMTMNGRCAIVAMIALKEAVNLGLVHAKSVNTAKSVEEIASVMISVLPMTAT
jgi:hypothetical protein